MLCRRLYAAALAAGLSLSACDAPPDETGSAPTKATEARARFTEEMLALKSRDISMSAKQKLSREVVLRHRGAGDLALDPVPAPEPEVRHLAGFTGYNTVKDYTVPFRYTYINSATVRPGATLTVQTTGTGTTDTVVLVYHKDTSPGITVLGYNDDFNYTLNSKVTWTNNTGINQTASYVVFAFSDESVGSATIKVTNGGSTSSVVGTVGGAQRFNDNVFPQTCEAPVIPKSMLSTWGANGGWVENIAVLSHNNYSIGTKGGLAIAQTFNTPTSMELAVEPGTSFPIIFDLVFSPNPSASGTIRITQDNYFQCP